MSDNALILLAKNPKLGHVKTRLAQDVGPQKALDIYIKLLDYSRHITTGQNWVNYLFYDQQIIEDDNWPSADYNKKTQATGDLGDRLKHALSDITSKHKYVIMIGTDCGVLTSDILISAFSALQKNDVVIGPTEDGGYYLIGVKKYYAFLFDDIPWSTDLVFDQTIDIIIKNNLSCCTLRTLFDIDYVEDWKRLGWKI